MIIIDASVATKLINTQEEGSDKARNLLYNHLQEHEKILVPTLLFIEVANALATKTQIKEEYIKKGISLLYESLFEIYEVTEPELIEASLLAKQYITSLYDMIYAVIAMKKNITLITADSKFVNKVRFPFIKVLS